MRVERAGWGKADGRQENLCSGNRASLAARVSQIGLNPGALEELPSHGDVLEGSAAGGGDVAAGNGADGQEGCGCDQHPLKSARHHCNLPRLRPRRDAVTACCRGHVPVPLAGTQHPHGLLGVPHAWLSPRQRTGALQAHSWCQQVGKRHCCEGPPYSEAMCPAAPACSWVVERSHGEQGGRRERLRALALHRG